MNHPAEANLIPSHQNEAIQQNVLILNQYVLRSVCIQQKITHTQPLGRVIILKTKPPITENLIYLKF